MRYPLLFAATISALCLPRLAATTIEPPEFEDLVARSEHVFRGTVTSTRCEWRGLGETRRIVTLVTMTITENVLGPATATDMELEFLGGTVGTSRMELVGQPQFKVGDDDILFVAGNGRSFCPLVAMSHGRYLVAREENGRAFIARNNGVPLASTTEVHLALPDGGTAGILRTLKQGGGLTPLQFTQAIRETAHGLGRTDIVAPP